MPVGTSRVRIVAGHVLPQAVREPLCGQPCSSALAMEALEERGRKALVDLEARLASFKPPVRERGARKKGVDITEELHKLEDKTQGLAYNIADHLPGPSRDPQRARGEVMKEVLDMEARGANHLLWEDTQRRYCSDGMRSNFVLPAIGLQRVDATGDTVLDAVVGGGVPFVTQQVVLAHPEDCERIAREHLPKSELFAGGFDAGLIFTPDIDKWRAMRHNLAEAFQPKASLEKVFPRVVQRAEWCVGKLGELAASGDPVNMSEFYLHETLAQLMLGLFGFPETFMEATNKRFRDSMAGRLMDQPAFMPFFLGALGEMMGDPAHNSPEDVKDGGDLFGPLSRVIETTTDPSQQLDKMGNIFIFAFAGHDTTGHTLTWLTLELARRPDVQAKLQAEVDALAARLEGRKLEYVDLMELKYMTRCVMETLRLHTAVPNGTFRRLEHDDWVHGEGGSRVHVPEGTNVVITSWMRHRDPALWGPDAAEFNPDRDFRGREIWDNRGIAAFNPSTDRFSPFTYGPRDCIGKNFAQSEMRAILFYVLQRFSFEFPNPSRASEIRGVNYGTMGPLDVLDPATDETSPIISRGPAVRLRFPVGLQVHAVPRK